MVKTRLLAIFIFLFGFFAAYFNAVPFLPTEYKGLIPEVPFRLGLDLQGGIHLVYRADTSVIDSSEVASAMDGLRDVIERRVNFFGVTEPVVQIQTSGTEDRLIVELPGVTDISEAIALIGETPYLEFRTQRPDGELETLLKEFEEKGEEPTNDTYFIPSPLTGRYLKKAYLDFNQTTFEPEISIEFTSEGADLFAQITRENVDKVLAIYLDGNPISAPVVQEEITGGRAQITGQFKAEEAKMLVEIAKRSD